METFTDDTIVQIASYLAPCDMLSLALTCKRFGAKHGTTTSRSRRLAAREYRKVRGSREVRQKKEAISLMEVAAHTMLQAKWSEEEKNALPRRGDESWIGLYHEFLSAFRLPLQFDRLVGQLMEHVEGRNKIAVIAHAADPDMEDDDESPRDCTAICTNIMRAGKHYVSFQVNDNHPSTNHGIECGIMRPTTRDITSLERCNPFLDDMSSFSLKDYEMLHTDDNVDCCLLTTFNGSCFIRKRWKDWEEFELLAMDEEQFEQAERRNECRMFFWEGTEMTQESSFKIGLVLDLDEGTLDVYKNDIRLGTMKSGLVGEYCWVVTISPDEYASVNVTISR